jgi:integrase
MLKAGLSPQTIAHAHRLVHKILNDALCWNVVARNVATGVTPPRLVRTEMHTPSAEDIKRILQVVEGTQYHTLFSLAAQTGLRRGELLALRWSDIDFDQARLRVSRSLSQLRGSKLVFEQPKTAGSRRTIALATSSVEALKARRRSVGVIDPARLVFCQRDGGPLDPNRVTARFVRAAESVGIKAHLHQLRHFMATAMLQQGTNVRVVSQRLGHASAVVTLGVYAHVMPGADRSAAELLDETLALPDPAPLPQPGRLAARLATR